MYNIWRFAGAVLGYWGSLVTGGVLIGLIGIYQGVGHPVKAGVYWGIAVIGLVIAFYKAWLSEHASVLAEQKRNEGSRIEGDLLLALIDSKRTTKDGMLEATEGCYVTVLVRATNMNPAHAYLKRLETRLSLMIEGASHDGQYEPLHSERLQFFTEISEPGFGHGLFDFFAPLGRSPMDDGEPHQGWLRFYFEDLTQEQLKKRTDVGVLLDLAFEDTRNKAHHIAANTKLQFDKVRHLTEVSEMKQRLQH